MTSNTRVIAMRATAPVAPPQQVVSVENPPPVPNDAPIFRGLFQNQNAGPISQDVRSLWGGVNPFLRRTT